MGYQDRHYYRDSGSGAFNPLTWLLSGSVPLFEFAGIRVRAHASLVVTAVLVLALGWGPGFGWQDRVQSMSVLFLVVLLHEFGHCFAARWLGGDADEILMTPIGGLAMARPPQQPLATFLTVAAGPAVNVIICIVCAAILWVTIHTLPLNPLMPTPIHQFNSWLSVVHWSFWIYHLSLGLLLFNILPIYPLDGGQMLQAALWKPLGYYKSMNFACITGMVGGVLIMAAGLATFAFGGLILMFIGFFGFLNCLQMRRALLAAGPEEYSDTTDYSAAYETFRPKRSRFSRWAAKRAMKLAKAERDERERIDQILAKVSAHGMHSLTWSEKRALRKATEHQRKRDMELGRTGRG